MRLPDMNTTRISTLVYGILQFHENTVFILTGIIEMFQSIGKGVGLRYHMTSHGDVLESLHTFHFGLFEAVLENIGRYDLVVVLGCDLKKGVGFAFEYAALFTNYFDY